MRWQRPRLIAAHDAEGVESCWLSDVCITHTTHGQHNGEHRIEVDLDGRVANEFGRWEGDCSLDDGTAVVRSGRFYGQWRWVAEVEQWLLNSEIVPEQHDVVTSRLGNKL